MERIIKMIPLFSSFITHFLSVYRRKKFTFDGSLYWRSPHRFPFCPRCFGESKFIEMQSVEMNCGGQIERYMCPVCEKTHTYVL